MRQDVLAADSVTFLRLKSVFSSLYGGMLELFHTKTCTSPRTFAEAMNSEPHNQRFSSDYASTY
jgi:hypothetical protein